MKLYKRKDLRVFRAKGGLEDQMLTSLQALRQASRCFFHSWAGWSPAVGPSQGSFSATQQAGGGFPLMSKMWVHLTWPGRAGALGHELPHCSSPRCSNTATPSVFKANSWPKLYTPGLHTSLESPFHRFSDLHGWNLEIISPLATPIPMPLLKWWQGLAFTHHFLSDRYSDMLSHVPSQLKEADTLITHFTDVESQVERRQVNFPKITHLVHS